MTGTATDRMRQTNRGTEREREREIQTDNVHFWHRAGELTLDNEAKAKAAQWQEGEHGLLLGQGHDVTVSQ